MVERLRPTPRCAYHLYFHDPSRILCSHRFTRIRVVQREDGRGQDQRVER